MRRVGVTGGVASGKSALVSILRQAGACCLDADRVVHRLLETDLSIQYQVVQLLGPSVLEGGGIALHGGRIDRRKVASIVFSDRQLLHSLEAILQPAALAEIQATFLSVSAEQNAQQKQQLLADVPSRQPSFLFIVEASVLLQAGWKAWFDRIVVVTAKESLRRTRYFTRQPASDLSFSSLSACQWSQEKLIAEADYIVENSGTLEELRLAADHLLEALLL